MPRERTFHTEAIVLRRSDLGEADRLLTLFSKEFGKLRAVAKGARKPQSRKTGHVELFMRSRFLLAEGRDLPIVTQAELVEAYAPLRADLVRATYAAYACELLDRFTSDNDRHSDMYELLSQALGWFAGNADLLLAARVYELRLLDMAGYRPQLHECLRCREAIREQDQFFSAELGGLLCPNCQAADARALPITAVGVKVLRYLQTRPWEVVQTLQLKRPLQHELENILHHYLRYLLERDLKSVDFLHRLRREANLFAQTTTEAEENAAAIRKEHKA